MSREHSVKKPCIECPFSKTIEPGKLGGSDISTYVGQSCGPFWLPCHLDTDFKDPNWKQDVSKAQCAGAAIFRANIGVDDLMPSFLHKLPPDSEKTFASLEEMVAYHKQISLEEARQYLKDNPPLELLKREMRRSGTKILPVLDKPR